MVFDDVFSQPQPTPQPRRDEKRAIVQIARAGDVEALMREAPDLRPNGGDIIADFSGGRCVVFRDARNTSPDDLVSISIRGEVVTVEKCEQDKFAEALCLTQDELRHLGERWLSA